MKSQKNKLPLDPKVNWWRLPEEVDAIAKRVEDLVIVQEGGGLAFPTLTFTPSLPNDVSVNYFFPTVYTNINNTPEKPNLYGVSLYKFFSSQRVLEDPIEDFTTNAEIISGFDFNDENKYSPLFTEISLPSVKQVVRFQDNGGDCNFGSFLVSVSMINLEVCESLSFSGLITQINFPKLKESGISSYCAADFIFPELVNSGSIWVGYNTDESDNPLPNANNISLPKVIFAGGEININLNATLVPQTLDISLLKEVNSNMYIRMPNLTEIDFPFLTKIDGNLELEDFNNNMDINFPLLTYTQGTYLRNFISSSILFPELEHSQYLTIEVQNYEEEEQVLNLDSLVRLQMCTITMPNLVSFSLPSLKSLGANYGDFTFNTTLNEQSVDSLLTTLASLDGTNGTDMYDNGTIDISYNNAAPNEAGVIAKNILIARGINVITN